ncbi:hypothetical protein [Streptomyces sp. NBC_00057]|uniref:hypothetical protein n=1 Tax=Streptomyces sp. NBC_00057 TaxID=2975634 RepID=UPI00386D40C8
MNAPAQAAPDWLTGAAEQVQILRQVGCANVHQVEGEVSGRHPTETCDAGTPNLIEKVATTTAMDHDVSMTGAVHAEPASAGRMPAEHQGLVRTPSA